MKIEYDCRYTQEISTQYVFSYSEIFNYMEYIFYYGNNNVFDIDFFQKIKFLKKDKKKTYFEDNKTNISKAFHDTRIFYNHILFSVLYKSILKYFNDLLSTEKNKKDLHISEDLFTNIYNISSAPKNISSNTLKALTDEKNIEENSLTQLDLINNLEFYRQLLSLSQQNNLDYSNNNNFLSQHINQIILSKHTFLSETKLLKYFNGILINNINNFDLFEPQVAYDTYININILNHFYLSNIYDVFKTDIKKIVKQKDAFYHSFVQIYKDYLNTNKFFLTNINKNINDTIIFYLIQLIFENKIAHKNALIKLSSFKDILYFYNTFATKNEYKSEKNKLYEIYGEDKILSYISSNLFPIQDKFTYKLSDPVLLEMVYFGLEKNSDKFKTIYNEKGDTYVNRLYSTFKGKKNINILDFYLISKVFKQTNIFDFFDTMSIGHKIKPLSIFDLIKNVNKGNRETALFIDKFFNKGLVDILLLQQLQKIYRDKKDFFTINDRNFLFFEKLFKHIYITENIFPYRINNYDTFYYKDLFKKFNRNSYDIFNTNDSDIFFNKNKRQSFMFNNIYFLDTKKRDFSLSQKNKVFDTIKRDVQKTINFLLLETKKRQIKIEDVFIFASYCDRIVTSYQSYLELEKKEKPTSVSDIMKLLSSNSRNTLIELLKLNIDKNIKPTSKEITDKIIEKIPKSSNLSKENVLLDKKIKTINVASTNNLAEKDKKDIFQKQTNYNIDKKEKNTNIFTKSLFTDKGTKDILIDQTSKTTDKNSKDILTSTIQQLVNKSKLTHTNKAKQIDSGLKDIIQKINYLELELAEKIKNFLISNNISIDRDFVREFDKENVNNFLTEEINKLYKLPYIKELMNNNDTREIILLDYTEYTIDDEFLNSEADGIDELLLPNADFDYDTFKNDLFDYETGEPKNIIKKINENSFIASVPATHPILHGQEIGREYLEVDVSILKYMLNVFYTTWQNKIFKFGMMDLKSGIEQMLKYLEIFIEYRIPPNIKPHADRVYQLIRWYSEYVIIHYSEYEVKKTFIPWKSDLHKGIIPCKHSKTGFEVSISGNVIVNTHTNAELTLYLDPKDKGQISFSYRVSGNMTVYINTEEICKINNDGGIFKYAINAEPLTIKFVFNGLSCIIGNIIAENCVFDGITTEYKYVPGRANYGLDLIMKRICAYYEVTEANFEIMEETLQGVLGLRDLTNALVEYYDSHHKDKTKGKRTIIKKS